jgi:hypothetical protein
MVQQSMCVDEVEPPELSCIHVEHVGNQKVGVRAEAIACVRHVAFIDINPDVFDIQQILDDFARATSNIEETLAGPRFQVPVDDLTFESVRANGLLIGAEQPCADSTAQTEENRCAQRSPPCHRPCVSTPSRRPSCELASMTLPSSELLTYQVQGALFHLVIDSCDVFPDHAKHGELHTA